MSDHIDPNSFLMGGGGAATAFPKDTPVGTVVGGTIVSTEVRQQTDYITKEPKTWSNGDPMMQLVVVVQTDEDDGGDDDGRRAFYLKGGSKRKDTTQGAVSEAVRKAGASGLEIGGKLEMALIGTEPSDRGNDRKLWSARYTRPTVPVGNDPFGDTPAPAQPAPAANDPFAGASADPGF